MNVADGFLARVGVMMADAALMLSVVGLFVLFIAAIVVWSVVETVIKDAIRSIKKKKG